MTFNIIITLINNNKDFKLFDSTIKYKSYTQYIYKFDNYIGIFNPLSNEFNCLKSDVLISNKIGQIEKIEQENLFAPPTIIDDFYSEDALEFFISKNIFCKQIGTKDYFILQFYFHSEYYSDFKVLFETKLKSFIFDEEYKDEYNNLFETLDIYAKSVLTKEIKPQIKQFDKIVHIDSTLSTKKVSKYVVKNTSKYEPKKKENVDFKKYKVTM